MIKIITGKRLRSLKESSDRTQELEQALSAERTENERLAATLEEACSGAGFNGLASVLCTTFATQLDHSRELGERQSTGLLAKLEEGRRRCERLHELIAAMMRHVGRLEGLTQGGEAVHLESAMCRELIEAANRFDRLLTEGTS